MWEGEGVVMRGGVLNLRSGGATRGEGTSGEGGRHAMPWAGSELGLFSIGSAYIGAMATSTVARFDSLR